MMENTVLISLIKNEAILDDIITQRNVLYNQKHPFMVDEVRQRFLNKTLALAMAKEAIKTSINELKIYTNTNIRNYEAIQRNDG